MYKYSPQTHLPPPVLPLLLVISETMARLPVFVLIGVFLLAVMTSACDPAVEFDEENQRPPLQRCRRQVQSQRLRHCEQFLTLRPRSRQILAVEEEEIDDANATPHLQACCESLRRMEEPCRCEALRNIVRRQIQQGWLQGRQLSQMLDRASSLPSICRLGRRRCDVRSVRY